MSEMIERIARAVRYRKMERSCTEMYFYKTIPATENDLDDVRAMLISLRKPTEKMVEAGANVYRGIKEITDIQTMATLVFDAMIVEALISEATR